VFALAVVMYEMLAIRRLFHRDSDFLTFKAITEEPIPEIRDRRPDLPPGMRAALLQAMARDPNGRFDSALAFGNAIRNSVSTLGGPATPQDLMRLLATDFGDEMAARDEILKAADDPAPIAPTRPARPTPPPPLPNTVARSGEVDRPRARTSTGNLEAVPSMIVAPGTSRANTAPQVLDLTSNVLPDLWMVDPNTDLLHGHRMKSMRNAAIAIGVLLVLAAVVFFATSRTAEHEVDRTVVAHATDDAAPADAGSPIDAPGDLTRDEIIARSRFGFFSIAATATTQIYIDNKLIGDTPLTRLPLTPGPHKVKAVGPHGKIKQLTITMLGGQDTDEGTITW